MFKKNWLGAFMLFALFLSGYGFGKSLFPGDMFTGGLWGVALRTGRLFFFIVGGICTFIWAYEEMKERK